MGKWLMSSNQLNVVYAADGRKLSETYVPRPGNRGLARIYSGSCIFTATALSKVLFDGGYVEVTSAARTYMFFLTDHLGSVRVVADENGTVRQVNQYYPYGDLIEDARMVESTLDNRYRVTGTVVRSMDVSADPIASTNIYVSMPASPDYAGSLKGYDLNGISSLGTDVRILTVCYYDGYGFNEGSTMTAYSEPAAGEPDGRSLWSVTTGDIPSSIAFY